MKWLYLLVFIGEDWSGLLQTIHFRTSRILANLFYSLRISKKVHLRVTNNSAPLCLNSHLNDVSLQLCLSNWRYKKRTTKGSFSTKLLLIVGDHLEYPVPLH